MKTSGTCAAHRLFAGAALATIVATAGCAEPQPVVREVASIRFQAGPCFGTCPVYSVSVFPDGQAVFVGHHYTAVKGERRFRISQATYNEIARTLAPLKPAQGSIPRKRECNVGDEDYHTLTWIGTDGAEQRLCVGDHDEITDRTFTGVRLNHAYRLLPIAAYVGPNMAPVI